MIPFDVVQSSDETDTQLRTFLSERPSGGTMEATRGVVLKIRKRFAFPRIIRAIGFHLYTALWHIVLTTDATGIDLHDHYF